MSGPEAIRVFCKAGFQLIRTKGSHHVLKKKGCKHNLSIPVHQNKTLGVGLLKKLISVAGMTVEEFMDLKED